MASMLSPHDPKENSPPRAPKKRRLIDTDREVNTRMGLMGGVQCGAGEALPSFVYPAHVPRTSSDNACEVIAGAADPASLENTLGEPGAPAAISNDDLKQDFSAINDWMPGWSTNEHEKCHKVIGESMQEIAVSLTIRFDKGFKYSAVDDAYVGQKKNHFQVAFTCLSSESMKYVLTESGLFQIDRLAISLYGVKCEEPAHKIVLEQSKSNRDRNEFHSLMFPIVDGVGYGTVQRLHFSEPTRNNMRKQGQPHPDQKFFFLAATVSAQCLSSSEDVHSHPIASLLSERLIVRASNPRKFVATPEEEAIPCAKGWKVDANGGSLSKVGHVSISATRSQPRALDVVGDMDIKGVLLVKPRSAAPLSPVRTVDCLKRTVGIRVGQLTRGVAACGDGDQPILGIASAADSAPIPTDMHQLLLDTIGATQELYCNVVSAYDRVAALEAEVGELKRRVAANTTQPTQPTLTADSSTT